MRVERSCSDKEELGTHALLSYNDSTFTEMFLLWRSCVMAEMPPGRSLMVQLNRTRRPSAARPLLETIRQLSEHRMTVLETHTARSHTCR